MTTDVYRGEWIGSRFEVVDSPNADLLGLKGVVVDETKNLVAVETPKGIKRVAKRNNVFAIDGRIVDGSKVGVAPEERIRLKVK